MKKSSLIVFVLLSLVLFYSCKSDKSKNIKGLSEDSVMELSQQDTVEVYNQANAFLECLKNKDLDGAMSLIYTTDTTGQMVRLPEEKAALQKSMLRNFLGLDYRINYLIFNKDLDNELKFSVILFAKESDEDHRPNEVGFFLRPMRVGSQWYLTVADGDSETMNSEIRN